MPLSHLGFSLVGIRAVELRRIALPLVRPFVTAHGTERERDVVLVRVDVDGVEGWGECAALAAPTYTSEWTAGAWAVLREHLVPRLLAGADLDEVAGHRMAKAALRNAVLDARLRAEDRSLAAHLGATRTAVPAGIALGLDATPDDVGAAAAQGYRRVKLKVVPGQEGALVLAREAHPALRLQADANGAYAGNAVALDALDDLGLDCIEQPLGAADLVGHAALTARLRTPVALDESIASTATLDAALRLAACRAVNLKQGRVGGLDEAVRIHDACVGEISLFCGGMLETGIGRAVNIALAALPGFDLVGDLSPSARWYEEDLTEPHLLVDGTLAVPDGPGIGRTPIEGVLRRRTVATALVGPG